MTAAVRGCVLRPHWITREAVRDNRDLLYVFGDNMVGRGMGGQAGAMRGEVNAIGVPTKWAPHSHAAAYFTDADWDDGGVKERVLAAFVVIGAWLDEGRDVVIPADGLGTGLAQLPERAPLIAAKIEALVNALSEEQEST